MGAFLVMLAAIALAIMVSMMPVGSDFSRTAFVGDKPSLQAVAANMVEFHRAAVDFASRTQNRNPLLGTPKNWSFTYETQTTVRCSGNYTGGTYSTNGNATSPDCTGDTSDFHPPSFMYTSATGAASVEVYNWRVYYQSDGAGGSDDILVTYANSSSDAPGGYTSAQVAIGLDDFELADETDWFWGVTTATVPPTLSDGTTTQNMPSGFSTQNVVAIATIIP